MAVCGVDKMYLLEITAGIQLVKLSEKGGWLESTINVCYADFSVKKDKHALCKHSPLPTTALQINARFAAQLRLQTSAARISACCGCRALNLSPSRLSLCRRRLDTQAIRIHVSRLLSATRPPGGHWLRAIPH
jgi:hypothetical protein